jgi:hypothetical protein
MHPSSATLVAFHDAEAGAGRNRRIAKHLSQCEKCRNELGRIRLEKGELAELAGGPAVENREGLAAVLSAIAAWREGRYGEAASELKARMRRQMEIYFGSPAAAGVDRPGVPAEDMFGKASEMLEVFLGPEAAEAARDDVFRGMDWTTPAGETRG